MSLWENSGRCLNSVCKKAHQHQKSDSPFLALLVAKGRATLPAGARTENKSAQDPHAGMARGEVYNFPGHHHCWDWHAVQIGHKGVEIHTNVSSKLGPAPCCLRLCEQIRHQFSPPGASSGLAGSGEVANKSEEVFALGNLHPRGISKQVTNSELCAERKSG